MNAAVAPPVLDMTPPAEDQTRVAGIFDQIEREIGFVPDGLRLYGVSPPLLETFVSNVAYFRGGTTLPPVLTTMIRYLVSAAADCQYCIELNEGFLDDMGVDLNQARAARVDVGKAPVDDRELVLLKLALRALDAAVQVSLEEIDAARASGWSDREIFDAVAQASSNRAFNHILATFGIERQGGLV